MNILDKLSEMNRFKLAGLIVGVLLIVVIAVIGIYALVWFQRDVPELHANIADHFKYGSIGSEPAGVPYWIWRVLPTVFPEHLPEGEGEGYARLGFIFEPDAPKGRPIGTTYRERPFAQVGLNCAACHVGTIKDSPDGTRRIVLGMPAHQLNARGYQQFLFDVANDERFNAETLIPAIRAVNPDFSWLDSLGYRFIIIPRTRDSIRQQSQNFEWIKLRPTWGPGRVDTFNPYKLVTFGLPDDNTVGTADLPSLWYQGIRRGMWLHWDANNNSIEERNISAAIGAGVTKESIDLASMQRIVDWISALTPPDYPRDKVDWSQVEAGGKVFDTNCAQCHALGGQWTGQLTTIDKVGTDPERMNSITAEGVEHMNTLGTGTPWRFSHFHNTNGYANMLLDGIWLRAPYLHNGSVPSMRDLLKPPAQRPQVFYRGYDVYDYDNMGFVSSGPEAEAKGFKYDTTLRGNGNQGHEYGTQLSEDEKEALLEFLKTQ